MTSVVLPLRVPTAVACPPLPNTGKLAVRLAALVTHVAQAIVPLVVIVPPVIGEVVAMLVTVPVPVPQVGQLSVTLPPKLTALPPLSGLLVFIVMEELASAA